MSLYAIALSEGVSSPAFAGKVAGQNASATDEKKRFYLNRFFSIQGTSSPAPASRLPH